MYILFLMIYFLFSQISCNDCFMGLLDENRICHKCPENCVSCLNQTYCETCSMDYIEKEGQCISLCSLKKLNDCTLTNLYSSSDSSMIVRDCNLYIPIDNSSQPDISSHRFTFEVSEFSHEFHLRFWFKLPADLQENISILLMTQYPYPLDYLYKYPYIMSLNFSNGMLYGPFHFTINPGLRINLGSWNHLSVNFGKFNQIDKIRTVITLWNFCEENPVESQTNYFYHLKDIISRYLYLHIGNLFGAKNIVQIRDAWIMQPSSQIDSGELQFFLLGEKFFKFYTNTSVDPKHGISSLVFSKDISIADDGIEFEISPLNITLLQFQLEIEEIFQNCLLFSINSYTGEIIHSSKVQFENSKLISDYLDLYKFDFETLTSVYFAQNEEKFLLSTATATKIFETLHNNVTFRYKRDGYCKASLLNFALSRDPWVNNNKYSEDIYSHEERNCTNETFQFSPNICVRLFQCPNNSSRRVIDPRECNENCEILNCANCENQINCADCQIGYILFEGKCIEKCPDNLKNFNRKCVSKCPDQTLDYDGSCIYCTREYEDCLIYKGNKTCDDCLQRLPEFCIASEMPNFASGCDFVPKKCSLWQKSESKILCKLCLLGYKLFNNTCLPKCPDGFYDDFSQTGCVPCNLEKNYVEYEICKSFDNIQIGVVAYPYNLGICPNIILDNKCLNKVSSIPGCIFEIEGLCYQCENELIQFKGRCFKSYYESHLNLIKFETEILKNPITKKFNIEDKTYLCPSSCNYCFIKLEQFFCYDQYRSENLFKVYTDRDYLSTCNPEMKGCFREFEGIIQFCTEKKCIGFPKVSYYMLPKDSGIHLIHDQGEMYKIKSNVKPYHSIIKIKNFLICKDSSEISPICFYKCPQGYYESIDKTECLPCHESCIECSENDCLRYAGQIEFKLLLDHIKRGLKFYSQGMIVKRFVLSYSKAFELIALLEFSEVQCPIQCEVCSINLELIDITCSKCIPGMILRNNECICPNLNDFFNHETRKCTSSCENFKLITSKGKECVRSCFEISAYTFNPLPFTLGDRCVSKCPHNSFTKTNFMYFDKIECIVNEAYLAEGDLIEYDNMKSDAESLVKRFGIFQVSLISPVFCPVEDIVYEKFDTIQKKLIFLDFIFGKTNELKYFPDLNECLLMVRQFSI